MERGETKVQERNVMGEQSIGRNGKAGRMQELGRRKRLVNGGQRQRNEREKGGD